MEMMLRNCIEHNWCLVVFIHNTVSVIWSALSVFTYLS